MMEQLQEESLTHNPEAVMKKEEKVKVAKQRAKDSKSIQISVGLFPVVSFHCWELIQLVNDSSQVSHLSIQRSYRSWKEQSDGTHPD